MKIEYKPIGIIHSPFTEPQGTPIQPAGATGIQGRVEIYEPYGEALKDLDEFSHIILLYHFDRSPEFVPQVVPFMDTQPRGLFATRAPGRPNPIGLSIVKLNRIEQSVLFIENLDILDGTPLLDIKPYVPEFDPAAPVCTGWLEQVKHRVSQQKADDRFK